MASTRYAAGAVDVGRLSRTALQVVGGVAVLGAGRGCAARAAPCRGRCCWPASPWSVGSRVHRRSDHRDHVVTVPVLRFTTRTGQRVEAEQAIALRRGAPERGPEVGVLYDPADPARAAVVGTTSGVAADAVFRILFGALFAFIASNVLHPWFFALVS